MSRESFDFETKTWMPSEEYYALKAARQASRSQSDLAFPMVMGDIKEYRSVIDQSVIGSRSAHREHLKRHDCVEVGNEWKKPAKSELSKTDRIADIKRSLGE